MYWTDGVSFRKLERSDLSMLQALKHESGAFTHHITICNDEDQNRWFNSLDQDVHSPRNLCLIGQHHANTKFGLLKITNADWVSRSADLAWDVFKDARGKGFGKKLVWAGVRYCFEVLNLRRLTAEILETNLASQQCAKFAGFKPEGRKREAIHKQGSYIDSIIYGVLSSEIE